MSVSDGMNTVYESIMSGVLSSLTSWLPSLILLVLETIILMKIQTSLYGLRFVPIFGEYFFYKNASRNQKLSLIYTILYALQFVTTMIGVFFLFIALFGVSFGGDLNSIFDADSAIVILLMIVMMGNIIATFVLRLILDFAIAENFAYNKYFGILFVFIPLVRDICCLVNADKFIYLQYDEDDYNGGYGASVGFDDAEVYDDEDYEE